MDELTEKNWNDLVNGVGNIGDKIQQQLVESNALISELNNTLLVTNIILGVIALTFIASIIIKIFMSK